VARIGHRKDAYSVLTGNLRANNQLEEPGIDGEDNIKMDFS
jgi:hypothetical protein